MNDNGRIQLAEAMNHPLWKTYINPGEHSKSVELPDPFTNANDDYAVLEWMRKKDKDYRVQGLSAYYKIGDYARAALKVIDNG